MQMTPNWAGGQSRGIVAFQRDLSGRLEEWTNRDLKKFNKGKCKVLHLGQTNPLQQQGLGTSQLESRSDGQAVADTSQG